ncbi:YpmS family protein [Clostridium swellfunianum]|uniref:YpmS family protein n=1 Tax=Clostridium swellfunianum TaxID=1367462 RepID=UPI002030CF49|nr:YpmS family protein [Clostridium swellfunianum]MCM0648120.1 YpmS family protein [Clostridium swellfunianum]
MKGFIKGTIIFIAIIVAAAIMYFTLIYPKHEYPEINTSTTVDIKAQIMRNMPQRFSLTNRKLTISISLSEKDLKNIIASNLNKSENIKALDLEFSGDSINMFLTQEALKFIPYEVSSNVKPVVKNGNITLILNSSKLGRLSLSNETVLNRMSKKNFDSITVHPSSGEITLEYNELSELKNIIKISTVKIENNKLTADLEFQFNSMDDFLKVLKLMTRS